MKVRNTRLLVVLAALVAVALIATGCGGGAKEPASTGGAAAEATTIKIGIGAPLTQGAVALGQGMKRGAGLAISQANESEEAKALGITFEGVDGGVDEPAAHPAELRQRLPCLHHRLGPGPRGR